MTETTIIPITASADGKRNSYTHACKALGQQMNYAACLNRLATPDGPSDWAACKSACRAGACAAESMRREEELQGRSLYFRAREAVAAAADSVRKWFMPGDTAPAPKSKPRTVNALDALGKVGTLGDALSVVAAETAAAPVSAPAAPKPRPVMPVAQAGETPLQIARRLAAERAAHA